MKNVVDTKEGLTHKNISIKDDGAGAPKEETTETHQQNGETNSPQTTTHPLSEPLDTAAEVPQTGKAGEASKKDQQSNINWLAWQTITQGLLSFIMISVLIYHAILFSGQQQALQDQSKLLAQSVEQTKALISQQQDIERPRIGVKRMELTNLTVGQMPTITVTFFNGGRTSATQFKFIRVIYFTREGDFLSTIQRLIRTPVNSFGGSFMPPGGEMKVVFMGNLPVRQDQLNGMPDGQVALFLKSILTILMVLVAIRSGAFAPGTTPILATRSSRNTNARIMQTVDSSRVELLFEQFSGGRIAHDPPLAMNCLKVGCFGISDS